MSRVAEAPEPTYCAYAGGPCDQDMTTARRIEKFFIYPSEPDHLAGTIVECVRDLNKHSTTTLARTWQDLGVGGQIVFCEICKAIRAANVIIANITTMNFNVLFEIGYALGLQKAVVPVRDASYERDRKLFDNIGIFDTLGYENFTSSKDLVEIVNRTDHLGPPVLPDLKLNQQQQIYYMRSPIETDGSIKMFSCLKKSWYGFSTFDPRETPRLSLHEAYRRVFGAVSVVAHLLDPERSGALAHNARAAFVCGMALAAGKHVLMLQEGIVTQPIDYRDIVVFYSDPSMIPYQLERLVRATADTFQAIDTTAVALPRGQLERIDLGDVAAENESQALSRYFVRTPEFQQARQGHARLVIGRKGSGKTALFYGIREDLAQRGQRGAYLIVDLKPEGHQFATLREFVLDHLTDGLQHHTLTAFWHYLLLLEIAKKTIKREADHAYRDPQTLDRFNALRKEYERHTDPDVSTDFSERLMGLVNRLVSQFPADGKGVSPAYLTRLVYATDIKQLQDTVVDHLKDEQGIWILFDNIDKSFPTHGLQTTDILMVRCLLEATRKLQRALEREGLACKTSVFLRRDVFDHLIDQTPDRGKEPYVSLDWSDPKLIQELLLLRIRHEVPELRGTFEQVWSRLFDPHVRGENSFCYVLSRTFLRPRDVLNFVRKALQIAVSRGHSRVEQEDMLTAEKQFSEDMLQELQYEIRDIYPVLPHVLVGFLGCAERLSGDEIARVLLEGGAQEGQLQDLKDLLLWFSFFGIISGEKECYAYTYLYNMAKLNVLPMDRDSDQRVFIIHPAFRQALETRS